MAEGRDLTQASAGLLQQLASRLEKAREEFDDAKVRCGITGISGSGKSSLINAIAGEKIARVNVIEETMEPQEHLHGGIAFVDLPGIGTARWPRETYVDRLGLAGFDCFILVTAHRFYDSDLYLYNQLTAGLNKPCFVVRNKFDQAIEEGRDDNDLSEAQVRELIENNLRANLTPRVPSRVYLTSARHPERYDLPLLVRDIVNSQAGPKRTRLVADVAAWSEEIFEEKKKVADHLTGIYSGLSAVNSLNPIPGLDVSVDIGLLRKLSREILHVYGLSEKQTAFSMKHLNDKNPSASAFKQVATRVASKYATEHAIMLLLKSFGKAAAVREISKWVPFVGTLVSAGVGFRLTYRFGEQLTGDCEEAARDFLKAFANEA